jgi:hypothetical protein
MSARSDAALSLAGGILGGLAIGTLLARRYLTAPTTPARPYSQRDATVTSIGRLRAATRKGE